MLYERDPITMCTSRTSSIGSLNRERNSSEAFFRKRLVEAELFLPWSAQKERGQIFDTCTVLEERADGEGVFLRVRGEPEAVKRLIAQFGEQFGRR